MLYFYTNYKIKGYKTEFNSYVVANTLEEAEILLKKRNNNEWITLAGDRKHPGFILTKDDTSRIDILKEYKSEEYAKLAHSLAFLGGILIKAKMIKPDWLLNDYGILHDVIHKTTHNWDFEKGFYQKLVNFDKKVKQLGY